MTLAKLEPKAELASTFTDTLNGIASVFLFNFTGPISDKDKAVSIKEMAKDSLLAKLNNGEISFKEMGLTAVSEVKEFFGERCLQIRNFNTDGFANITPSTAVEIADHFPNVESGPSDEKDLISF